MNLKGITAPLAEKIGAITEILQELIDSVKAQTALQEKILAKLNDKTEGNSCKSPENPD